MHNIQQDIDERSNLTNSNKMELLLFRLGGDANGQHTELYGINVFKVREIVVMPEITKIADSHPHMLGVVKVREEIIPVIDLPTVVGCIPNGPLKLMLITEFARTTQAFAVEAVDEIVRLAWTDVLPSDPATSSALITSIAKIDGDGPEGRLAQVLDVESILRLFQRRDELHNGNLGDAIVLKDDQILIAADDSIIARTLIEATLKELKINYEMHASGKQVWDRLQQIELDGAANGRTARERVALILSDLEMPEMDGFTLTRKIKKDIRYSTIPVVIHSSLSGAANEAHVDGVGADAYIAKFAPEELSALLRRMLA